MAFNLGSRLITNLPLVKYLNTVVSSFRTIELPTDPRFLSPNLTYTSSQKHALRIYRERYQLIFTMHAPFIDCRLGAIHPEERQLACTKFLSAMELASDLQIQYFTFHPTIIKADSKKNYRENYRLEEESLDRLLRRAKTLGLTMLIENMPKDPLFHPNTSDGSRFQELLWLFPEPEFGLTVDIGHALQAGVSLDSLLKMDRIRHFHLHDNDRCLDRHLPVTNHMEWWARLVKKLTRKFPDTTAILEMLQIGDQLTSLYNLKPFLKQQKK